MRGRILALAVAGLAVAAAPAAARSTVITLPRGFAPMGSTPSTLAGTNVVYSHPWEFNHHVDLWIQPQTGPERLLIRFRDSGALFTGSSRLLAILHGSSELLAGPPDGPFSVVSRCAGPSGPTGAVGRLFTADDADLAYLDDGCGGGKRLVVDQVGSPGPPATFAIPNGYRVDDLALAGPYVAYHLEPSAGGGGTIVEADWRSGAETVRVADGASNPCGVPGPAFQDVYDFCGVAVQPDGKLARTLGQFSFFPGTPGKGQDRGEPADNIDTCRGTIDWLSPSSPTWHHAVSRACVDTVDWLRGYQKANWMAGDRVLYSPPPSDAVNPIAVSDLQGNARPLGDAQMVYGFDGQNVLVDDATCTTVAIYSQSVLGDDPPLPFIYGSRCPVRFSRPVLRLGRHPRFSVTVRCPHGCRGPIAIGTWNDTDTHTGDFTIEPGGQRRFMIRLSPRGAIARTARRRGKVTVVIDTWDVTSFNPHESTAKQDSQIPPRSATARFTLKPRR